MIELYKYLHDVILDIKSMVSDDESIEICDIILRVISTKYSFNLSSNYNELDIYELINNAFMILSTIEARSDSNQKLYISQLRYFIEELDFKIFS